MNRLILSLTLAFAAFALPAYAQNAAPVVASPIADFTVYAAAARSFDLGVVFRDPDASNAVRMTTVLGTFDIALFGQQKPITVTNFLNYVDQGRYFLTDPTNGQPASSFVHRTVPGFIIQGGGYLGTVDPISANEAKPTAVLPFSPIQNEPGISNTRGTIAMAQSGTDANSATSQWFINLTNNTSLDVRGGDPAAGPYTVFGRVVANGMTVVDAIAAVPRYNFGGVFAQLPLRNYSIQDYNSNKPVRVPNFVSIPGITQIPPLAYSAASDNPNVSVTLTGSKLVVSGNQVGSATITLTATDLDGAIVQETFVVNVVPAPGRLVNLSTRMQVGTGDNALIAGFIMQGSAAKRLAVRALGPSLTPLGVPNALANPVLELRDSAGATIASNDDWGSAANSQELSDVGLAPGSAQESAILTTVPSSTNGTAYTAIMRGVNDTTGVGVVEVYDLDSGPGSTLLNISTRGQVGVDPNALIGGFILGGSESKRIFVRAIGPSLTQFGIPNALANPTLELRNAQGGLVDANDDWMNSAQKTQIENSGLAPTNAKESAVVQTLPTGQYTAIVRGVDGGTGVGSVEVYQLP